MKGRINAFYGAQIVHDNGAAIGRMSNGAIVDIVDPFGKPWHHAGEWVKVTDGDVTGWIHASQLEAPTGEIA